MVLGLMGLEDSTFRPSAGPRVESATWPRRRARGIHRIDRPAWRRLSPRVGPFLASRPELAKLADRAATRAGPEVYRLGLGGPGPQVLVLKQGGGRAAGLAVDPGALPLDSLLSPARAGERRG
jgi:hypothetical protein